MQEGVSRGQSSAISTFLRDSFLQFISKSHKRIFELVNIVADRRYNLHEEFLHGTTDSDGKRVTKLQQYLDDVKKAAIAGLDDGGIDPFAGAV